MATEIDEAGVRFIVKGLSEYLLSLETANGATTGIGTTAETAAVKSSGAWTKIGKAALASGAIVGVVAVGMGVAALKIASDLDAAYDSIQIKTGETGTKLEGLKTSFENVFSNVPSNAEDVAEAIGTLNQKLDLTGGPLEALSTQVLNLSRITGTDLTGNIDAVVGAFQRWQVPAEAMPGLLDELFRASQESGIPVADLATSLQDNKAVIDGLQLSLPEAVALIAGLGKSGIDADTAFQGLKLAMTKMAKEGVEDPKAALEDYFNRIKNAKTDAEATAIATDIFGKSSVNMANAIRDGSFDLKAFTAALDANKNTINDTAAQTDDWKEKLEVLRNRVIVAISPALNKMFSGLTKLVDDLQPQLDKFSDWWTTTAEPAIKEFWAGAEPIIKDLGLAFGISWKIIEPIFTAIKDGMAEVLKIIGNVVSGVSALLSGDWASAWESAKSIVTGVLTLIQNMYEPFLTAGKKLIGVVAEAVDALAGDQIRAVVGMLNDIITAIASFLGPFLAKGKEIMGAVLEGMQAVFGPIITWIVSVAGSIGTAVASWGAGLWDKGYAIINAILDGLKAAWETLTSWLDSLPDISSLLPGGGVGFDPIVIPIKLMPGFFSDPSSNWMLDWWNEQQDKERMRQELEDAMREWFKEHPLDIKPPLVNVIPDRLVIKPPSQPSPEDINFPVITIPVRFKFPDLPDELRPGDLSHPTRMPGSQDELTPGDLSHPTRPGSKDSKPSLKDLSDPAQFLELVLRAISTIEALADADIAPVNRKKLLALAGGLRSIIVEFGHAMQGIKPEVAEAAAIIASFLDPILDAIDRGVDTINKIAQGGGIGQDRIKAVLGALRAITVEATKALSGLDAAKLKPTAETAVVIADLMESLAHAARAALDLAGTVGGGTQTGGGTGGGTIPGTGGGALPADGWAAILAGIRGSLPGVGSRLQGAVGGPTYNVVAQYSNPQTPQSIRLDLEEIMLAASA